MANENVDMQASVGREGGEAGPQVITCAAHSREETGDRTARLHTHTPQRRALPEAWAHGSICARLGGRRDPRRTHTQRCMAPPAAWETCSICEPLGDRTARLYRVVLSGTGLPLPLGGGISGCPLRSLG